MGINYLLIKGCPFQTGREDRGKVKKIVHVLSIIILLIQDILLGHVYVNLLNG